MRLFRLYGITALASSSLLACAHSGSEAPQAGATASKEDCHCADEEAATSLQEHHRHHHDGGVTAFIAMGMDTLGADPAKHDQLEKIEHDLQAKLEPAREAEKKLVVTLADGIAAGTIDTSKVNAALADLTKAAAGAHDASTASLNELHAVLSPAERAALVEKVQAHWEVWRKVNHDAQAGSKDEGGRLDHVAHELNLTPDQVDKASTALHKAGESEKKFDTKDVDAHMQAFSTAFVADKFDAKTLNQGNGANGELVNHGAERMVTFYETLNPVLTPEQRTELSKHLHDHLNFQRTHEDK